MTDQKRPKNIKPDDDFNDSGQNTDADTRAIDVIKKSSLVAAGAMVMIPIPFADMGAVYGVWAKMVHSIALEYGENVSMEDARALATDIFKHAILNAIAWFASAKTASTILKFIPFAGTLTAYVVDAMIAGFSTKKITYALGGAAAAYYKSGRTQEPKDFVGEIGKILKDPRTLAAVLAQVRKITKK